jgi:hypothetical protein
MTNPDLIIPQLGMAGKPNPTCEDAAEYAPYSSSREVCRLLQSQAAFCGCPESSKPEATCSFCPNGEPPEHGDKETPFRNTCDELSEYVTYLTPQECETERGETLLRNSFLCGCAFTEASCAMCPDGSIDVMFPERVVPFFNLNAAQANPTCEDVAAAAAVAAPKTINCDLVKAQAGYCGCTNVDPEEKCHFCPNGALPERMKFVTPTTDTCENLYYYSEFMAEDDCQTPRFHSIQGLGYICGCPDVEAACTLCPDNSDPPNPDQQTTPDGPTCGDTANVIASYTVEVCSDQDTTISVAAARCGCEGAELPACTVQQNPHLCTHKLLDTTTVDCECYSFCDGVFSKCHDFPGGLLSAQFCNGIVVSGCNRANAREEEAEGGKEKSGAPGWKLFSSLLVLVVLATSSLL